MRLFALLPLLLVLPTSVDAAPKSKKAVAPSESPAGTGTIPKKKAVADPCPDVSFTPAPLVVQGIYESEVRHGKPHLISLEVRVRGHGVIVQGWSSHGAFYQRLDRFPADSSCKASAGQSTRSYFPASVDNTASDPPGAVRLRDVSCSAGPSPRCELTFSAMTIAMEPKQAGVCESATGTFRMTKTVVATPASPAAGRSSPSIRFTTEPQSLSSGVEYLGVLTAVPHRAKSKKAVTTPYRATFSIETGINASVIGTLYPGCVAAEPVTVDRDWSFVPTTRDINVLMWSQDREGPNRSRSADCRWYDSTPGRVLACILQSGMTIPLANDLI